MKNDFNKYDNNNNYKTNRRNNNNKIIILNIYSPDVESPVTPSLDVGRVLPETVEGDKIEDVSELVEVETVEIKVEFSLGGRNSGSLIGGCLNID